MQSGPELRGSNISLDTIVAPTDESTRHTKIVCTLGPACWKVEQLEALIDNGLSVARFNFSHGDHEGHGACLERLRTAAKNKGVHVGTYIMIPIIRYHVSFSENAVESFPSFILSLYHVITQYNLSIAFEHHQIEIMFTSLMMYSCYA